ncbi:MAG: hypothetical protein CME71_11705 [Halobacteriovorax sp.]|nr:hypothetical protein [Halobacteriovorax sp.]
MIDPLLTKASTDPEALSPADAHGRSGDTPLPPNCPDEEQIKFANQAFPTVNIEQQVLLFRDYYRDKLRTNWREAWKSWCARAQTDRRDPNRKEGNDDPRIDPYLDAAKALRSGECESETSE